MFSMCVNSRAFQARMKKFRVDDIKNDIYIHMCLRAPKEKKTFQTIEMSNACCLECFYVMFTFSSTEKKFPLRE